MMFFIAQKKVKEGKEGASFYLLVLVELLLQSATQLC